MPIDNVADLIAETLIQAGVKRIFGVVGDSLNGLTEALRNERRSTGFMSGMRKSRPSPPPARRKSPVGLRCVRGRAGPAIFI